MCVDINMVCVYQLPECGLLLGKGFNSLPKDLLEEASLKRSAPQAPIEKDSGL